MVNPFDIYPPATLEKYPFLKENKYFEYAINLTPSQIKKFGKNNIVTLDFTSNKEPFKVFLTNTQIKKVEVAKRLKKKVKTENARKSKKLKNLKLQDRLETLKTENANKEKKLKSLKVKQGKINFDTFTKNTLKKYNEPKKKKIADLIKFPEINLI